MITCSTAGMKRDDSWYLDNKIKEYWFIVERHMKLLESRRNFLNLKTLSSVWERKVERYEQFYYTEIEVLRYKLS